MPGYGTLITARNLQLRPDDNLEAIVLTATHDPSLLQLTPHLYDPCNSESSHPSDEDLDLERGLPTLSPPYQTPLTEILRLAAILTVIALAYFTLVGVPVAVGYYCFGYSALQVLRVVVPAGVVLNAVFCAIFCADLWDEAEMGDAREALVLFAKTLATVVVFFSCVFGTLVVIRGDVGGVVMS